MRLSIGAGSLALALVLAGCGGGGDANNSAAAAPSGPISNVAAPNGGDWTQTVTRTPEGGTRMGNPDAPVKLVEYGSLTCPACKAFSDTGTQPLVNTYVRSGQVSWEFRHLPIHGAADVALAMLSDCMPQPAFFRTIEGIYHQQSEIIDRFDESEQQQLQSLPPERQVAAAAQAMELGSFFAQRGLTSARQSQCLADTAAVQRIAENANRAFTQENVRGTPTFFINGEAAEASTWQALEPLLRQRIGG
jgi:protein-disulfide isomerase